MRIWRRGRILRIRPGPLANFSGGAGYMPCVIIFTAPLSLLMQLIGSIVLETRAYRQRRERPNKPGALIDYGRSLRGDLGIGAVIAVATTIVFAIYGMSLTYTYTDAYLLLPCLALAGSPFALYGVLALLHMRIVAARGPHWAHAVLMCFLQLVGLAALYLLTVLTL